MAVGDQINVPAADFIDATVDPQSGKTYGAADAIEVAEGPSPCTLVFECNGDGFKRTFTNLVPGKGWTALTITKVWGTADGTTATAVRLRWTPRSGS